MGCMGSTQEMKLNLEQGSISGDLKKPECGQAQPFVSQKLSLSLFIIIFDHLILILCNPVNYLMMPMFSVSQSFMISMCLSVPEEG